LNQGCGSEFGKDPYSFEPLDPDPYSEYGSGSRCENCPLSSKKVRENVPLSKIIFFSNFLIFFSQENTNLFVVQKVLGDTVPTKNEEDLKFFLENVAFYTSGS
jgi:hypothetical protein